MKVTNTLLFAVAALFSVVAAQGDTTSVSTETTFDTNTDTSTDTTTVALSVYVPIFELFVVSEG